MIQEKIKQMPDEPGVYRYYDESGVIIYVGKATHLKSRVKSYFTGNHNTKTQILVASIRDIEYTIVDNPTEALLLENTLIKKHQPKYNILLKDDKTYPYIKITEEEYPRVITTRKREKDRAEYFGPFSSEGNANILVDTINDLFPLVKLPNCGKREPCLYYHTKSCLAPCHFYIDKKEYRSYLKQASSFFEGSYEPILSILNEKMKAASEGLQFEFASELRDKITRIRRVKDEQNVLLKVNKHVDVINYDYKDGFLSACVFLIRSGILVDTYIDSYQTHLDEIEALAAFIEQYYAEMEELPKEVYLPHEVETMIFDHRNVKATIPKRGDKKQLLEMVRKNAKHALHKIMMKSLTKIDQTELALRQLKEKLKLKSVHRIEMFDNSNIGGVDAVSAMVCFTNGKPNKKEYRKYKIKTIQGANDVGTMKEVIRRRYSKEKVPDLLLVDGGIPQVNAAKSVLDELGIQANLFGIAKNEYHKSNYVIDSEGKIYDLAESKAAFRLLTQVQEEVHRFAIAFFRKTHKKSTFHSILDDIKGVGSKRKNLLLNHFNSLNGIKKATISDIEALGIPKKIAEEIINKIK